MVLGTAQFGMDYGIANISGKPTKKVIFSILDLAWEKGVRRFDTAPGYGSETLLGEFIFANGLQNEAIVLTKIPSIEASEDYMKVIKTSIESSLKALGCPVGLLFFHNQTDANLLLKDPKYFENILNIYPVSALGVSVYEKKDIVKLSRCEIELAFQFPFNVLDRRFEQVTMPKGKRYARSIFLQGLLVSKNALRFNAPKELINLQKKYHDKLTDHNLDPVEIAVSFALCSDSVDYFLIGVDSAKQLRNILELEIIKRLDTSVFDEFLTNVNKNWFDPRI